MPPGNSLLNKVKRCESYQNRRRCQQFFKNFFKYLFLKKTPAKRHVFDVDFDSFNRLIKLPQTRPNVK